MRRFAFIYATTEFDGSCYSDGPAGFISMHAVLRLLQLARGSWGLPISTRITIRAAKRPGKRASNPSTKTDAPDFTFVDDVV